MSINPPARVYRKVDPAGLRSAEATSTEVANIDDVTTVDATDAPQLPVAAADDVLVEAVQYDGENHDQVLGLLGAVRGGVKGADHDEPGSAPAITVEVADEKIVTVNVGDVAVRGDGLDVDVQDAATFAANFEEVQRP